MKLVLLLTFPLLMAIGQLLFKKTAMNLLKSSSNMPLGMIEGLIKALYSPWIYLAILVYFFATLSWLYILQRVPISIAYPFAALAMVIVPLAAMFLFEERLNWHYWLGTLFIITGITIIAK